MTVEAYAQGLEERLRVLCDRVHSGRYRLLPVRRVYIPKADGGQRPLGVLALEDKIVIPRNAEEPGDFIRAVTAGLNDLEAGREISLDDAAIRLGLNLDEAPP